MRITHNKDYAAARAAEYPPIEDLADAIFHAHQGDYTPLNDYLEKVSEVKSKYPKNRGVDGTN